jgi:hypothetical protein
MTMRLKRSYVGVEVLKANSQALESVNSQVWGFLLRDKE